MKQNVLTGMSSMTPKRYRRLRELFEAALARNPASRLVWLEAACSEDEDLRNEVRRMLIADSLNGALITTNPIRARSARNRGSSTFEGRRIGPYNLLREIGRGGMGSVYLAERADNAFNKLVALKIVHLDVLHPELTRRFQQERQVLARLEHPNIARLLDGGATAEGWPYLVMEYIDGKPIDSYCDDHRLNVTDRLRLFRTACTAVSYAHQNLIVHRDLKPSNILVTALGDVKLVDFGIAKLLNPEGQANALTKTHFPFMTPEYASPEQIQDQQVTTASDVYSLGVVLYELLTGRKPYQLKSHHLHELIRAIAEEEPVRPSAVLTHDYSIALTAHDDSRSTADTISLVREGTTARLRRRLVGDLDTITLKALQREPARRYPSVDHLSQDLHRHLTGLPVHAQPDTAMYRGRKFIIRNRRPITVLSAFLIILIIGLIVTVRQAYIAEEQRAIADHLRVMAEAGGERAEMERAKAETERHAAVLAKRTAEHERRRALNEQSKAIAANTMAQRHSRRAEEQVQVLRRMTRLAFAWDVTDSTSKIAELLAYLDRLNKDNDVDLMQELADTYTKIGDLQMGKLRRTKSLVDPHAPPVYSKSATRSYASAVAIWSRVVANAPSDVLAKRRLSLAYEHLAEAQSAARDRDKSVNNYQAALQLTRTVADSAPSDSQFQSEVAMALMALGNAESDLLQWDTATAHFREAYAITSHLDQQEQLNVSRSMDISARLGWVMGQKGELNAALKHYEQALHLGETLHRRQPHDLAVLSSVAAVRERLGDLQVELGFFQDGLVNYRRASDLYEGSMPTKVSVGVNTGSVSLPVIDPAIVASVVLTDGNGNTLVRNWIRLERLPDWLPDSLRIGQTQLPARTTSITLNEAISALRDLLQSIGDTKIDQEAVVTEERRVLAWQEHSLRPQYGHLLTLYVKSGDAYRLLRNMTDARKLYQKALSSARAHAAKLQDFESISIVATSLVRLSTMGEEQGDLPTSLEQCVIALDMRKLLNSIAISMKGEPSSHARALLASTLVECGKLQYKNGSLDHAAAFAKDALRIYSSIVAKDRRPRILHGYADALLSCEPEVLRDPARAVEIAKELNSKTGSASPLHLAVFAKAQFRIGDSRGAAETQGKARGLLKRRQGDASSELLEEFDGSFWLYAN